MTVDLTMMLLIEIGEERQSVEARDRERDREAKRDKERQRQRAVCATDGAWQAK